MLASGAEHRAHYHPNNFLSGVYYVRTHPGADTINFHDPRSQTGIIRPPVVALTGENTCLLLKKVSWRQSTASTVSMARYADRAGRFIVEGRRLPLDEAAALPRLHLEPETASALFGRCAVMLGFLAAATGLLLLLADRRIRRVGGLGS